MFALVALDRVKAGRDRLTIGPDLVSMSELPTPFGRATQADGKISGKWVARAPTIVRSEE
jgi:hypothetical protein